MIQSNTQFSRILVLSRAAQQSCFLRMADKHLSLPSLSLKLELRHHQERWHGIVLSSKCCGG